MKRIRQFLIALLLGAVTFTNAQTLELTVANQQTVGTDFFFDIYLQATSGTVYLGGADFVLTFNSGNFNSPVLYLEGDPFLGAFCAFVPTNPVGTDATRELYSNNIGANILNDNELIINLNAPTVTSQSYFDQRVALINNVPSTHRLGRFKVSGISIPGGNMGLTWKTAGGGVITKVYTIANTTPWAQTVVTLSTPVITNTPLPVELSSFAAKIYDQDKVKLNWKTQTEVNNYGFDVERQANSGQWEKVGFVNGNGNSNSPNEYSYIDNNLIGGSKFLYRLKQIDNDGQFTYTDAVEVEVVPNKFELSQNYPNPFNPSTKIKFAVPEASKVSLKIYDMTGAEVVDLVNADYEAGYYDIDLNLSNLASGIYLYRFQSKGYSQVKKMMLLK